MDSIWLKTKTFLAEEAARRSETLTISSAKIADIVSETAKKSKEFAVEASKKADEFKTVALRQADQHLKSVADQIPSISLGDNSNSPSESELETFGITDDLRQFARGFSVTTFESFSIQDDSPTTDVPTVLNVRQDLTEWQQKHAVLVLTTVKEISRLRYELCPRHMKDRIFWRIYFTLVSSHVALYEKKYMEEVKQKEAERMIDYKDKQTQLAGETNKSEAVRTKLQSKTSTSSSAAQDLDIFLLGDLDDSDGSPDVDDEAFDDDFDKIDKLEVEEDEK
ncbi:unnamed protein product [Ilex paraguariensis]|uniref:BSD domain-containing protein n=1 Tax=Ilex paraguariensis TaxID=185542 RepID=A0ABC8RBX7_9AQUA